MLKKTDALLIVDVQRDFLPGGALAVPDGDAVVPALAALAQKFAAEGLPVIASRDWHPADHCSFVEQGGPWPPHCVARSEGATLDPGLELPENVKIIDKAVTADKDAYSAFEGTGLADWLRERGVERVVVGGLATEYCVLNTAADGLRNGFDVLLVEDAIRAIDDADGQRAIDTLRDQGAKVGDSGAIING
jgi:nicotinamidase/pyrazinamidase